MYLKKKLYLCSAMGELLLYRLLSWLRHLLSAWNTGGEGVHSPYLFEWVRMVMSDKHAYYVWEDIEALRAEMLRDNRMIAFVDYGSGKKQLGDIVQEERLVRDIAKGSLARKQYAQMLFRLVNWLGDGRSLNIVELGTSLGVTTSYLAAVDSRNRVVTLEGCKAVAEIAKENWRKLGLRNIECWLGEVSVDSLQCVVDALTGGVDVAYIDANHTYASTREYFNVLAANVHEKSVIVVDDIHHSKEMERAWNAICADARVTSTIDLYQMGLVFFDKHYWKRNYRMIL